MKDLAKLLIARLRSQSLADVYLSSPWLRGAVAVSPPIWRALANLIISKERSLHQIRILGEFTDFSK